MNLRDAQHAFYVERVPEQFNQLLECQRTKAAEDPSAARVLEEMQAVRTSIVVQVDAGEEIFRHVYDIDRGEMKRVDEPAHEPFLVLGHSLDDFPHLRRECGDSLLGFLGGLAGLGEEMRLTSLRVRSLRDLHGGVVFERTGRDGFAIFATFGIASPPPVPHATIRVTEDVYARLRAGKLDPQDAFLEGRVEIEGDMEIAVSLALAALSPE